MLGKQKKSKTALDNKKRATRKKTLARTGPSGLRISTMLFWGMGIFMLMIIAVGALSVHYLRYGDDSMERLGNQNQRAQQVLEISNDMLEARVTLMTAARYYQEAEAADDDGMRHNAQAALRNATDKLGEVRAAFQELRRNPSDNPELRRLATGLVAAFQAYMDDGIDPMVQALESQDYHTFYFVNNEFGVMRALAFQANIEELKRYYGVLAERDLIESRDQTATAVKVIGLCLVLGLALMVVLRVALGRLALTPLRQAGEHFDHIANGDLTRKITYQSANEVGVLFDAMRRMQASLQGIVTTVRQGVDEIASGANQIYAGNTDLSSRTEEQAASLQETAASLEELASTVRQNSDNAAQADKLAQSAADVAHKGGESVAAVVDTMNQISTRSGQVADIVNVIDGIAFQTNILALNAAVEAARAGEQGKGFAVVAGEVRSLAQRSAQAAREIKTLIEASLQEVSTGTQQVANAGVIIGDVVKAVNSVTTLMAEISSASQEQTSGIDQINVAVTQMDAVVQQNAALVEQAAAAAGSLQSQSERLADAVAVFKVNAGDVIDMPADEARRLERQADAYLPEPAYS